jgi:hypothetical protein
MSAKQGQIKAGDVWNERSLKRRDLLKLSLAGGVVSCLARGCQSKSSENPPNPPEPPEQVFELTDGHTLYDDFDGHGNLQSYNSQNLAEAGHLTERLWDPTSPGPEVVQDPEIQGRLTVVNEEGQRIEYRKEGRSREIKYVFDGEGRLIQTVPHIPGEPYHASKKLLWTGARDGLYKNDGGSLLVEQGKIYGGAGLRQMEEGGWVLKIASRLPGLLGCILANRREIEVADFKSFSADVMLPSSSTGPSYYATLSYHTTIPEQPPGLSWLTDIGIRKTGTGRVFLVAYCINRNTGYRTDLDLGPAQLDTWYNVRLDIVTQKEDPTLSEKEFRIEYYVNGKLLGTEVPEDAELLLDPLRTGTGPDRFLRLNVNNPEGESIAYFDNVKGVYVNRIS